jgi:hypothetical protein
MPNDDLYEQALRLAELETTKANSPYFDRLREREIQERLDKIMNHAVREIEGRIGRLRSTEMKATNVYLDENGLLIEVDNFRLRLSPDLMRRAAGLIQMYALSKLVPDAGDEPPGTMESPQAHP